MIICIGAGPGDVGYLTQRGAELIREADVDNPRGYYEFERDSMQ